MTAARSDLMALADRLSQLAKIGLGYDLTERDRAALRKSSSALRLAASQPDREAVERIIKGHCSVRVQGEDYAPRDGVYEAAEAILSLLSGAGTKSDGDWSDIGCAPKDGTSFIAWENRERGPFKCWWRDDWTRGEAYWMDSADSEPNPKYWRPMLAEPVGDNLIEGVA